MSLFGSRSTPAAALSLTLCAVPVAVYAQVVYEFDQPAQPLADALRTAGSKAGVNVAFRPESVQGLHAPALKGHYSAKEALERLIQGAGLVVNTTKGGSFLVEETNSRSGTRASGSMRRPDADVLIAPSEANLALLNGEGEIAQQAERSVQNSENPQKNQLGASVTSPGITEMDTVVVTGTHIRGAAPDSSPVTIYTYEDIERTGAASVEQFLRTVPQNFSAYDRSTAQGIRAQTNGVSPGSGFAVSTMDIHGVGNQATLVLLNGRRLAPAGYEGQVADVSLIPLSAIERVDIMTDGASAIYGTDAVAGVVNFVLKEDFSGAETVARYGWATRGGDREVGVSQLLGARWSSGNVMLAGEYQDEGGLYSTQRSFLPQQDLPVLLLPKQDRQSFFMTGRQALFWGIEISGDVFFNERHSFTNGDQDPTPAALELSSKSHTVQRGFNLELARALPSDWMLRLQPSYARTAQNAFSRQELPDGDFTFSATDVILPLASVAAKVDGPLFRSLGADGLKAALGVETRSEKINRHIEFADGSFNDVWQRRRVTSAYGELFAPLIGARNARTGIRRAELSAALRYDDYEAIGSTVNPKFGALWSPLKGLILRATYGESFRAPSLEARTVAPFYYVLPLEDPSSPTGTTATLFEGGVTDDSIGPERSRSFTVGLDIRPESVPGLSISATYFRTRYRDRIANVPIPNGGDFNQILRNPELLSRFLVRDFDLAHIQAAFDDPQFFGDFAGGGPAGVELIFLYGQTNIASSVNSGVDLSINHSFDLAGGVANASIAATHLIENSFLPTGDGIGLEVLNDIGTPVDLKVNSTLGWSTGSFSGTLALRYVDGYYNRLTSPVGRIDSWITCDLHLAYRLGENSGSILEGTTLSLAVRNLTDERPPVVLPPSNNGYLGFSFQSVNFDPINADALGRLVSVQIKKQW